MLNLHSSCFHANAPLKYFSVSSNAIFLGQVMSREFFCAETKFIGPNFSHTHLFMDHLVNLLFFFKLNNWTCFDRSSEQIVILFLLLQFCGILNNVSQWVLDKRFSTKRLSLWMLIGAVRHCCAVIKKNEENRNVNMVITWLILWAIA